MPAKRKEEGGGDENECERREHIGAANREFEALEDDTPQKSGPSPVGKGGDNSQREKDNREHAFFGLGSEIVMPALPALL